MKKGWNCVYITERGGRWCEHEHAPGSGRLTRSGPERRVLFRTTAGSREEQEREIKVSILSGIKERKAKTGSHPQQWETWSIAMADARLLPGAVLRIRKVVANGVNDRHQPHCILEQSIAVVGPLNFRNTLPGTGSNKLTDNWCRWCQSARASGVRGSLRRHRDITLHFHLFIKQMLSSKASYKRGR